MNLNEATKMTEDQAREYVEHILWPKGPNCPHCGNLGAWKMRGKSMRAGLWKCSNKNCRKPFTVTMGTVMESSHISIRDWVIAFHLMCSSKKGISALQLKRNLGLGSYESAWFLEHRIRHSMNENPLAGFLKGTVEVDETYVGGKPRKENKGGPENPKPKKKSKRGRGTDKVPVLALVERKGKVFSKPIEHVDAKTLKSAIKKLVHKDSTIMTDEWASYTGIGKDFKGGHEVVKHSDGEFKRGNASTNTVESYFALLKRGVHGIFHHVSKHHLHRYCDEFSFRWNRRKSDDGQRTVSAITNAQGKRLTYNSVGGRF
ncbi:MAG: IS1595 family transposase [Desulfomonilaceae bacterium]